MSLSQLLRKNSRLRYQKITSKSISFGLEKALVVSLPKGHMDLLFPQSVLHQVMQLETI